MVVFVIYNYFSSQSHSLFLDTFPVFQTMLIDLKQWALIELCRKPEKQKKLRQELLQFVGVDPTLDQLSTGLPYLDAVVQGVLRLHPPVSKTTRIVSLFILFIYYIVYQLYHRPS